MSLLSIGFMIIAICFAGLFISAYRYAANRHQILSERDAQLNNLKNETLQLKGRVELLQDELRDASLDSITQLPSWVLFEDRVRVAIDESGRHSLIFSLMFVDVSGFKLINSALGQHGSNQLLRNVADRLKNCVRKVDSLSRFNQSTFCILLARLASPEKAAIVAERIIEEFSEPFKVSGRDIWLNASIGIAVFPVDGQEISSLISNAQQALNQAKLHTRQLYYFYQQQLSINSYRELELAARFSQRSVVEELKLKFSPVMDLMNQKIQCMDVAISWQHPEYGIVSDQEIKKLIRECRKSKEITNFTLRQACKQFQAWQAIGFDVGHIAIELDRELLQDTHFIYEISSSLQALKFNPQDLIIKTKIHSEQSLSLLEKSLNRLHYIGVKLLLDEAASSYFPLDILKAFNFSYIKLNARLIEDLDSNEKTQLLLSALKSLAQVMSLELIFSDVSSQSALDKLQQKGFYLMQGQIITATLPEEKLV